MKHLIPVVLLLVVACGQQEAPPPPPPAPVATPYGSVDEVVNYRAQIEPYIVAITAAQAMVDQKVGSAGRATVANLATAMQAAKPQLQAAQDSLQQLQPPLRLTPLHAKIGRLVACRLEAYTLTIDRWHEEQTTDGTPTSWREQEAEAKLAEANDLIRQLNDELQAIETAVRAATPQQVASP
jgi:hypothetical protein